jgi:cholesterol oxidase
MTASVQFTEEMLGHVTFGESDFARGAVAGRDGAGALKFHLTIVVDDIERFGSDPTRRAGAHGYLVCDALGGRLPVERGVFNLFVDTEPGVKHMLYRLWFRDGSGHPLTMSGFKLVKDDALRSPNPMLAAASLSDVWKDTTTLFTRVLRGHVDEQEDASAEIVASGVLRIRMRDFARQLTTFRAGGDGAGAKVGALAKFGTIFVGHLAEAYLRKGRRANGATQG